MTIKEFNEKYAEYDYVWIGADEIAECPEMASHEGEYYFINGCFGDLLYSEEMKSELVDKINNCKKSELADIYNLLFDRKFVYLDDQDEDTLYREVK